MKKFSGMSLYLYIEEIVFIVLYGSIQNCEKFYG